MKDEELREAIEYIKAVGAAPGAYMHDTVGQLCDDLLEALPSLSSPYGGRVLARGPIHVRPYCAEGKDMYAIYDGDSGWLSTPTFEAEVWVPGGQQFEAECIVLAEEAKE